MFGPYGLEVVDDCRSCHLRREHFFCSLPDAAIEDFQLIKYTAVHPHDATLFMEGEAPRGIHVLCQGEVKLSITSLDGKRMILRVTRPGEVLGLNSCIAGQPYDVTAQAHHPCQTDFVKREDLLRFLRRHSEALFHCARELSKQFTDTQDVIRSVATTASVRQKLARLILDRAENSNGRPLRLGLTHEEISEAIGTSRESVTRTLAEFKKTSLIFKTRELLLVRDKKGLERLCGISPRQPRR